MKYINHIGVIIGMLLALAVAIWCDLSSEFVWTKMILGFLAFALIFGNGVVIGVRSDS